MFQVEEIVLLKGLENREDTTARCLHGTISCSVWGHIEYRNGKMRVMRSGINHEALLSHIKVIELYLREGVKETRVSGAGEKRKVSQKEVKQFEASR